MSAAAPPLVNGIVPSLYPNINEAAEYQKILKLRDEVFAGSHPRLTVPTHALRTFSPCPPQSNSQSATSLAVAPPVFPTSTASAQLAVQPLSHAIPSPSMLASSTASLQPPPPARATSEINPVLLEKSKDLVQAELRIQRQRLEKALKEQFEQKRREARKRPPPSEAKPDFDISVILTKVVKEAKPATAKEDAEGSDSFDENSFYSSRAPDSTPERAPQSPSPRGDEEDNDTDAPSGPRMQSAVMGAPLNAEQDDGQSPQYVPRAPGNDNGELDDEEEEGEYSPPEALEDDGGPPNVGSSTMQESQDPRGRPLRRYSEIDDGKRPQSPSMRIVRNHITSPLAPQPSRVSPFALAKDGPLQQNSRMRRQRPGQLPSPESGYARKKRKMDKKDRRTRRNGGLSPDAFIKEENISPPPFHAVQPLGSGRVPLTNADRPIVIDDGPQEVRYVSTDTRYMESPTRPLSRVEPQSAVGEPRTESRTTMRATRDDQDLRRVASLHLHSLRTEQTRDYVDTAYETPIRRVASYREPSPLIIERSRPVDDETAYYDRQPLQEVRVSRTPVSVQREVFREEQPQIRYEPMPPPPAVGRIVVDQHGRRFREILPPPAEQVSIAAPRAVSVRPGQSENAQYDNYRSPRAGSVFVDIPRERRYVDEMPPPPSAYRQIEQVSRASALPVVHDRDQYEQPGPMRSASVQVIDRPASHTVYVDDRPEFREPVRVGSVRLGNNQYEDMRSDGVVRASSARPSAVEYIDDRVQTRKGMHEQTSSVPRTGIAREMAVMDQQPHLVAPMKLTVFDMLPPPTPPASGPPVFQWMTHTKNLASRASSRASLLTPKKMSRRPAISDPQPVILRQPSVRRNDFRPLELSIYLPSNRLSDLPAFDGFTFTDLGEIQFPPKALLRTTSEQFMPAPAAIEPAPPKAASMFERRMPQMHRNTHSSSISSARSQLEYDALHSHPVSWCSPPGMPPQIAMATEPKNAVTVLDPMQEEATPPTSGIPLSGTLESFPAVESKKEASLKLTTLEDQSPTYSSVTPASHSVRASDEVARKSTDADQRGTHFHTNYQTRKRISQWLGHRPNLSSTSTVKTTMSSSTTLSFADHRRKRAQFYKLSASYAAPPKPFRLPLRYEHQDHHQRSMTVSTMQSSNTPDSESVYDDDMESMTTAPTASEVQSRTGTIRSVCTAAGVKQPILPIIVSGIPEVPGYLGGDNAVIENQKQDNAAVVKEINGPLRGPIGIAF
ncbi:hypothetical protein DV736_g3116, partial [Chaetothyriales sp. CBS 134916]